MCEEHVTSEKKQKEKLFSAIGFEPLHSTVKLNVHVMPVNMFIYTIYK